MLMRPFAVVVAALAASAASALHAQALSNRELLSAMRQPDDLARYRYLVAAMHRLDRNQRPLAQQFLAFAENELGLYGEAVRDFPLRSRLPEDLRIPQPPQWRAADAIDTIAELSAGYRVVMVNEAHHDAHTRALTLALLPRMRALGFTHLALEALDPHDAGLAGRGYPVAASGSEYLHEPVYGDIVRQALALGFVLVPYDPPTADPEKREEGQARALYRQLADNPRMRLLVHAGYAHIDHAVGRLGRTRPMAERLHALSGLDILSIDQTDVREDTPRGEHTAYLQILGRLRSGDQAKEDEPMQRPVDARQPLDTAYYQIVDRYQPKRPIVLRAGDGTPWSARPGVYDLNVILPPAGETASDYPAHHAIDLKLDGRYYAVLPPTANGHRPNWLSLGGQRQPFAVTSESCARTFPCLVEAHYANESADATPADRYVFLERNASNKLWLRPGSYRLRTVVGDGKVLQERTVEVAKPLQ